MLNPIFNLKNNYNFLNVKKDWNTKWFSLTFKFCSNKNIFLGFMPSIMFLDEYNITDLDKSVGFLIYSWLNVIQLGFLIIFLLLLSARYTRTGEFALLMNRLAFIYVLFFFWVSTEDNIVESFNLLIDVPRENPNARYTMEIVFELQILYAIFTLIASLTIITFFYGIIDRFFIANSYETEYSIIVLLIFLGAIILVRIQNFIEFIIAIEIVTFGTYILVAYEQQNRFSVYAGVQYFILGSIPSAMLILAISWIYSYYGILTIKELELITDLNTPADNLFNKNFVLFEKKYVCNTRLSWETNFIYNYQLKLLPQVPQEPETISWTKVKFRDINRLIHLNLVDAELAKPYKFNFYPIEKMRINNLKPNPRYEYLDKEYLIKLKDSEWSQCNGDADMCRTISQTIALEAIKHVEKLYPTITNSQDKSELELYANALQQYRISIKHYNQTIANIKYILNYQEKMLLNITDVYMHQKAWNLSFDWNNLFNSINYKDHKIIGILLFFSYNLLFKLTAAPFHFWALSIYEKAPISSVTILSIFTKLMVIFLILKVFYVAFFAFKSFIGIFYIAISILTAIFAIIGAFITSILKKFFVYSSMGHVAFMLIPLAFFNAGSSAATLHYLMIYIISSFIMWFILYIKSRDNNTLLYFKQFKTSDPLLGVIFSMLIFSMSGIPPFGGFYVKLDVLTILLENSNFYITFLLFFCTVASFFYYLRLIKIIYFDNKNEYINLEILSPERIYIIIVLFLILIFYNILIQIPLLYSELEFLTLLN